VRICRHVIDLDLADLQGPPKPIAKRVDVHLHSRSGRLRTSPNQSSQTLKVDIKSIALFPVILQQSSNCT